MLARFYFVGGGFSEFKVDDAHEAERIVAEATSGNGILRVDDTLTSSVRLINVANVTCVAVDEDG